MEEAAAYELPLHDEQRFFHDLRYKIALYATVWGIAGILSTTDPGVGVNLDHIMLYFLFLIAGVLFLLLTVAAQDQQPMAVRAAARFEGWIGTLFNNEARRA